MGEHAVIDIRLTALADAIRSRDWERTEFEYDRVRSSLERTLGIRARPSDLFRAQEEPCVCGHGREDHASNLGAKRTPCVKVTAGLRKCPCPAFRPAKDA